MKEQGTKVSRWWLFKTLRKHRKLAEQRMLDLNKNKVAKWFMGIVTGLVVIYLLMFAITFALAANDMHTMSSIEFICAIAPFMMALDFFIRFTAQQTPSQIIKPYVLLPLPKYTCVDFFLTGQMLNWSNLIWFVMIVPYCLMSVLFSYGFWPCIGLLFFFWILELCISQFYLIVRTLINDSLLWWLMPLAVLVVAVMPGLDFAKIVAGKFGASTFDFEDMFRFYGKAGTGIETGQLWPYLILILALVILIFINRKLQYSHVMTELSRQEKITVIKNPSNMKFLNHFGELGLYLGLEIKTTLRNKNPRKSFIMGMFIVVLFSLLIIFTDVYDNPYMGNFWCMYNYTIFGATTLIKIMANEGNYIDGLMVRKENILQILKAKYWFNCCILLVPFILMLPTVFSGKWSIWMLLSYGLFTAGFQFCLLFQLAVLNRTTQPLNTKFISKNGMENNYWQIAIEMICLFVPVIFVSILQAILGDGWSYAVMSLIGLAFIISHNIWLRNIYNRFMKRRYKNMEGFRASR